ncbi:MAG: DUF4154 domain-containing protein [Bacteroidia bacterium]|nr:DUF4154 domain-containing protein [Bacteroidia bacterium]
MMKLRKYIFCFLIVCLGTSFAQTPSQSQKDLAAIKAQSIYNFVNHIEWPNFDKLKEFRIGLLGADKDLVNALNRIAANSMVMRLPLKILPLAEHDVRYIPQTEILYVDAANFKNFDISKIKKNVLVISYNQPDIYRSMVSFMVIDNKLKFAFNHYLTKKAGFYIHDEIRSMAAVYIEDPNQANKNRQAQEQWVNTVEKTNLKELAKIKAQSIYNFVNYIEWPRIDEVKEFKIGLLAADQDLIDALNVLATTKVVMRLPIKILPFPETSNVKKLPQTEILYVDVANFKNFDIAHVKKEVLVISYNEPDLSRSMISFMVVENDLKFAFNAYLARKAELDIHEEIKNAAAVYIEDPGQSQKGQLAKEKWENAFEKIQDGLYNGNFETVLSQNELLEIARKISEQEKNINEQKEKISNQMAAFRVQEDSLKKQKAKLGYAMAQNKIQEASIQEQKDRINSQLNAIQTQESRLRLQEEKLNLTIAQNQLQENELNLKVEELKLQQQRITQQNNILESQKAEIQVQEDKLFTQLKKINAQKTILWLSLIAGLAIILSLSLVYRNYKKSRKTNALLENQKTEIEHQKSVIEEKHMAIKDSILYAERIQRSFLASEDLLNKNLHDYFILYQPRDVVSGDFYWASILNNGRFAFATADSTGHGVPGAIMSLLNITSLEKAIESLNEPAEILNHTRKTIIERLKKDGSKEGGWDGMDCTLMVFNFENNSLQYAAANNPLWILRNNDVLVFSPDKMPVGRFQRDHIPFSQHSIQLQKGDIIYTTTDGIPDQFGGPEGKKFMYKRLKELLLSIAQLPMNEQKIQIKKTLDEWMKNKEQLDDITLIGIRV